MKTLCNEKHLTPLLPFDPFTAFTGSHIGDFLPILVGAWQDLFLFRRVETAIRSWNQLLIGYCPEVLIMARLSKSHAKLDSAAPFDEECSQRDAANQTHESRKTHRIKGDQAMAVNYRPLTLSCRHCERT